MLIEKKEKKKFFHTAMNELPHYFFDTRVNGGKKGVNTKKKLKKVQLLCFLYGLT